MHPRLQRALLLIQQGRHDHAAQELRQALAEQPNHAMAHAALALCLVEAEKFAEATQEAGTAIQLEPDNPFGFYAMAIVFTRRNRFKEAEQAIRQAIDLDPHHASYFALLGQIHLEQSQWQQALDAAEEGLRADPANVDCTNVQARALVQTNRREAAREVIQGALEREPENAWTHANLGWTLLDERKYQQAMEHFREALRLQPDLEWARLGIVEALKAKRLLYRPILAYFLWISKFSSRAQWMIIVGAFIGVRVLRGMAAANPALEPWVLPIIVLYSVWAFSTWMAAPLFNLALLLDPFGRLALSRPEKITAAWVGLCVLGAVLSLIGVVADLGPGWLPAALVFALLIPPISRLNDYEAGEPRRRMLLLTAGLALVGIAAVVCTSLGDEDGTPAERKFEKFSGVLLLGFVLGSLGMQFAANAQATTRRQR